MSTERESPVLFRNEELEAQIRLSPWDEGPRHVYADWLLERGAPLGVWLTRMRGKVMLAELGAAEGEEMRHFLEAHGESIFGRELWQMQGARCEIDGEQRSPLELAFWEGYLAGVTLLDYAFEASDREPGARIPIGVAKLCTALLRSPIAIALDELELHVEASELRSTTIAPGWTDCPIRELTLSLTEDGVADPPSSAALVALKQLEKLTLRGGRFSFRSEVPLPMLKSLTLRAGVGNIGAFITIGPGALPNLEHLSLVGFNTTDKRASPSLSILEQLNAATTPRLSSLRVVALDDMAGLFARIGVFATSLNARSASGDSFLQRLFGKKEREASQAVELPRDAMIARLAELIFSKTRIDVSSFESIAPYAHQLGHLRIKVDKEYVQSGALEHFAKVGLRVETMN